MKKEATMHAKKTGLWTLALVLLLACTPESPEEEKRAEDAQAKAIAIEARAAYDQGNHQEAIRLYQEALDIERDPYWQFDLGNSYYFLGYYREALDQFDYFSWSGSTFEFRHYALYNAACCHALLGNEESAFSYLDKAIRAGFYDLELLSTDPDLASIRTSPRFDRYFPPRTARNNVTPAFPIKYSQETLIFEELETPDLPEGSYALVASKQAKLFNNATPTVDEEAKALEVVMEIPYLTIIPIVEELKASNPYEIDPFFEFEGDVNTFYRTEYSGQAGLIWGADLSGINSNIKDLVRTRHYYSKDESSPAFYPFNGYKDLSEEVQAELKEHHIAVEMVDAAEYSVGVYNPSDMLALYENRSRVHTHFLTTDIFLHVYHILFSNLLQEVEITQLLPKLQGFTGSLIKLVDAPETQSTLSQANAEDWEFLENYLLVGRALLSMTPALEEYYDQYNDPKTLSSGEIEAILDLYPPVVQEELRLILGAGGSAASPLFGSQTNYSLYKPRGHYTKNQYLEAYFRAMMWFGNRNFDYKPEDLAASRWKESLMLFSVLQNNPDILAQWKELFDPISFLIGVSENITVYDLQKYLNAQTPGEIDSILGNDDVSQQMIQGLLAQKTKEISEYNPLHDLGTGFSPFETPGFRLLGQRFTLDSFIHSLMTKPAIAPPRNVSGLDILASMGNPTARATLEQMDPYAEEILPQIDRAAAGLEQIDQEFWLGQLLQLLPAHHSMRCPALGANRTTFLPKICNGTKKP
jgi:tetratricopeptide (TPR) repeat protein